MKIIRDARLCDNCFKVGHFASGCMQKSGCCIEGCNGKHMTVIHPPECSLPARQETNETHEQATNPMQEKVQNTPFRITRLGPAFLIQAETPVLLVGKYAGESFL